MEQKARTGEPFALRAMLVTLCALCGSAVNFPTSVKSVRTVIASAVRADITALHKVSVFD
jgi:hypothetical protein